MWQKNKISLMNDILVVHRCIRYRFAFFFWGHGLQSSCSRSQPQLIEHGFRECGHCIIFTTFDLRQFEPSVFGFNFWHGCVSHHTSRHVCLSLHACRLSSASWAWCPFVSPANVAVLGWYPWAVICSHVCALANERPAPRLCVCVSPPITALGCVSCMCIVLRARLDTHHANTRR